MGSLSPHRKITGHFLEPINDRFLAQSFSFTIYETSEQLTLHNTDSSEERNKQTNKKITKAVSLQTRIFLDNWKLRSSGLLRNVCW
jgi:phage-related baseplate assembly protein